MSSKLGWVKIKIMCHSVPGIMWVGTSHKLCIAGPCCGLLYAGQCSFILVASIIFMFFITLPSLMSKLTGFNPKIYLSSAFFFRSFNVNLYVLLHILMLLLSRLPQLHFHLLAYLLHISVNFSHQMSTITKTISQLQNLWARQNFWTACKY